MAIVHEGPAPYAPVAHVLRAIEHYREKGAQTFSKELLGRLGYPDAYATRTIKALKLLDLIDNEGAPTEAFKELKRSTAEEFAPRLEQIVRTAYAEVFEVVDPATDTPQAIDDAFRFYTPEAQRDKMVPLFMGICEAAGIIGADRAPRKRLRTVRTESGRKRVVGDTPRAKAIVTKEEEESPPPEKERPPASPSADALRLRYVDMLMKKAEAQDDLDTGLLDRIEALLYEKRDEGEQKD